MVVADVSLEMCWQLLVGTEVDAKKRDEKLKFEGEKKPYVLRLVNLTKDPGNDESELLWRWSCSKLTSRESSGGIDDKRLKLQ